MIKVIRSKIKIVKKSLPMVMDQRIKLGMLSRCKIYFLSVIIKVTKKKRGKNVNILINKNKQKLRLLIHQ